MPLSFLPAQDLLILDVDAAVERILDPTSADYGRPALGVLLDELRARRERHARPFRGVLLRKEGQLRLLPYELGDGAGPQERWVRAAEAALAAQPLPTNPEWLGGRRFERRTKHGLVHLDVPDEPPMAGSAFAVSVWTDVAAADLAVWLSASDHLEIQEDVKPLDGRVEFELAVTRDGEAAEVVAIVLHAGRPCGSIARAVGIERAPQPPVVDVDPDADSADLIVTIIGNPSRGRAYRCSVSTGTGLPVTGTWAPGDAIQRFFAAGRVGRIAALRAAGMELFDAAPQVFRDAYWALVDARRTPKSIFIVSEEPHCPWELMVPRRHRPGGFERHDALGVGAVVGRAVGRHVRPSAKVVAHHKARIARGKIPFTLAQFAGAEPEPLVFLSARDSDLGAGALTGAGAFADGSAACVVAPLWALPDDRAAAVEQEFFMRLRGRSGAQPAALLRDLRRRAYTTGDDAYAAYCFFGDPLTRSAL